MRKISAPEHRIARAKEILRFIMARNAKEGVRDNDIRRIYKVLENGTRYERIYRFL